MFKNQPLFKRRANLMLMYFFVALIFFQCQDQDLVAPQRNIVVEEFIASTTYQTGNTYYVATTGNDGNSGASGSPWRTLKHATTRVAANAGHTIKLAAGTYVENGQIQVPAGVSIDGAGIGATIIKAASSFYYNPTIPAYAADRFLILLNSDYSVAGKQVLKNFTIDGDGKKLHGGIQIRNRTNVNVETVRIQYTNFTGMWLWDVKDAYIKGVQTLNCSWASKDWQSGAINVGNLERVEMDKLDINEGIGYGVKAIGPGGTNQFKQFTIHDSKISVHPVGTWNGGSAPNIAIEFWQANLVGCQIYNCYIDNTISLVNSNGPAATGVQAIRIHHNTLDMETRSAGVGYGVELTIHDVEIDHNYFIKGQNGIANWDNAKSNWNIHHNIFYGLQGLYPAEILRSERSGLQNVKFYNNTIEFMGNKTSNVIGVHGGTSNNVDLKNNLIINSNTSYNYYPNRFINKDGNAVINSLSVSSNLLNNIPLGSLVGSILNNLLVDPRIGKSGVRPTPYYVPSSGSPLIDGGVNVGFGFSGSKPDIGACESGTTPDIGPTTTQAPAALVPPPPATTYQQINLDASQAALTGKMTMGNDATAGSFFGVPSGNGTNYYIPAPAAATYTYQAPKTDNYILWVKVKATNSGGFYVHNGKGRWTTWSAGVRSTWTWVKVSDVYTGTAVSFALTQGTNTVQFGWMNDNVQVDKIVFTNDPNFTPSN